ncbi:hypothetical protein tb265_49700 [Gemmatimonadetes bacterium T265]|nr:hypothetical protein tb265_49700 [Gemmatimonadetes bacterium T265]
MTRFTTPRTRGFALGLVALGAFRRADGQVGAPAPDPPPRGTPPRGTPPDGTPRARPALALEDVVRRALVENPDLRVSRLTVDAARGAALSAASVFDMQLQANAQSQHANNLLYTTKLTSVLATTQTYSVGVAKRLRAGGIVLTPQLNMVQSATPGVGQALSSASATLGVVVPLARDRGGVLSRVGEIAAGLEADATSWDARQTASSAVLQAVDAYWAYLAAQRRRDVSVASEARAASILEDTRALVKADERPPADLVQLRGNVATQAAARIAAEQAVVEAWQQLALLLALPPDVVANPPAPSTDFPAWSAGGSGDSVSVADAAGRALVPQALRARADVTAAGTRAEEAQRSAAALATAFRPQIDLSAQFGYSGLEPGQGFGHVVGPLYRNTSPLNATVLLSYHLPLANDDARGRALQADASFEQARVARREVTRRAAMGVVVAAEALRRARLSLGEYQRSTALAQETVTNERRKFQLGTSTVLDLIYAEDALTNAQLAEAGGRQQYAAAIVRLRYETGSLVVNDGPSAHVPLDALLRAPDLP